MALLWVVGLQFQSLGLLGLQLRKLYVARLLVLHSCSPNLVVGFDICFKSCLIVAEFFSDAQE